MTTLPDLPDDALARLRRIASANGWTEISYDAREEQQRRVVERAT